MVSGYISSFPFYNLNMEISLSYSNIILNRVMESEAKSTGKRCGPARDSERQDRFRDCEYLFYLYIFYNTLHVFHP